MKNGQPEITALPYRAGVGAPPGVEVEDFPGLVARAAGHGVDPYGLQRPEFHKLIAVRSGTLRCSLDFTDHELGPGGWLWARRRPERVGRYRGRLPGTSVDPREDGRGAVEEAGQLHRYDSHLGDAQGRIVLFLPGFLDGTTAVLAGVDRSARQPASVSTDALWPALEQLEGAYTRWGEQPSQLQVELLRHLLAVLVLQLAAVYGTHQEPIVGDAFPRFQEAVEQGFARSHQVADYAAQLGYSVRTLTRASQAATGHGAKRLIDDRVLLEAKRLLIHTDLPAASIAQRVGFPEATVFAKFFRQHTEQTPTEFRAHGG
jgi:AraC-like DNA-binding protein